MLLFHTRVVSTTRCWVVTSVSFLLFFPHWHHDGAIICFPSVRVVVALVFIIMIVIIVIIIIITIIIIVIEQ
ncbi:hypothetical protein D3C80_1920640 [compost metagenome]